MLVRFWGTRGSLARPGPTTLQYGGNTSCVEVRATDGTLVICDGGTGLHGLGHALMASGVSPVKAAILISHTHWDHIQGIPFFLPLFVAGNEFEIYGPAGLGRRLEETLAGQMEHEYYPVELAQLAATIRFHDIVEGRFEFGSIRITSRFMNHPAITLGYRLEADGGAVVYATDHEPHSRHPVQLEESGALHREDDGHIRFLRGADVVIHDAQYTAAEYRNKIGWGHSSGERAVDYALAASARRLVLFHHDPLRDDRAVTALLNQCRERVNAAGGGLDVSAAAEGDTIEVSAGEHVLAPGAASLATAAMAAPAPAELPPAIVIADDDPDIVTAIESALRTEGYRMFTCDNGARALELVRQEAPDLLLIDWQMPVQDGLSVCRALRADPDPRMRTLPVVMLTAMVSSQHTTEGFAAGATDYLTKPASPAYLRSKVQQWLMRTRQARARWSGM